MCGTVNTGGKKTCFAGTPYWIYFFPLYTSSSETPAIKIPVINTRRHKYLHHTQTGKATLGHFLLNSTGLEYKDHRESYNFLTRPQQKRFKKFVDGIILDCDKYVKERKKPRQKKKVISTQESFDENLQKFIV